MDNLPIEKIANESIKNAMLSWISGRVINASLINLNIFCHSDKYLSFGNAFEYSARRVDYIRDYTTIDMKSGKRVMLKDLVEINESFAEYIQKSDIAKISEKAAMFFDDEGIREYLKKMESAELLNKLEECSLTQEQVLEDGTYTIDNSIEALVFRNSFYLQNNKLIIVFHGDIDVAFCLDDIAEYLKVEKW